MKDTTSPREIFALLRALSRLDGRVGQAQGPPDATRAQERDLLRQRLPTEIARLYDRLFDSGRRPTVVATFHEHCEGCHMRVPPQIMVLLTRAELVCRCPNCHRFLSPPGLDEDSPDA
jgi:predicted  nucleic acid-binding Zn-ribbon protein